jgi:hypothetical protein
MPLASTTDPTIERSWESTRDPATDPFRVLTLGGEDEDEGAYLKTKIMEGSGLGG